VDIAQGLGEQVTVMGFSMGGVLALWLAQNRADIALACSISPALASHAIPIALTTLVIQYYLIAPNQFRWWAPQAQDAPVPPLHAYPRYATRGLAHIVNIGLKVRAASRHSQPKASSVLVIINPTDESVDNTYAREVVSNWQTHGFQNLRLYEFNANYNLNRDLIEPDQPRQQTTRSIPSCWICLLHNHHHPPYRNHSHKKAESQNPCDGRQHPHQGRTAHRFDPRSLRVFRLV
jgi:pimeloyl-ACP methyl ester carboxylesterase